MSVHRGRNPAGHPPATGQTHGGNPGAWAALQAALHPERGLHRFARFKLRVQSGRGAHQGEKDPGGGQLRQVAHRGPAALLPHPAHRGTGQVPPGRPYLRRSARGHRQLFHGRGRLLPPGRNHGHRYQQRERNREELWVADRWTCASNARTCPLRTKKPSSGE